jgi:hypothetical protein
MSCRGRSGGPRRGYFEVQRMDGLAYLRALGAPLA